ncbi:hypothetical protein CDO73_18270 [Saccharibacillus sp. O23]|uniref:hypothetical protein n=1 Tax=Saccharibacillus sp. O23 TaxID=2009338 RepID=UPI000B4E118E|nr:hypothetical protein [Saccharibacillus sp. O23]OWR28495.1 hypothetical protein CDO73_18270 [Saccharibacillus sp. O23]
MITKVTRSKLFFPLVALIVWIAMILLFGSFSRFSLAGLGLLIYGVCIAVYSYADDATVVGRSRQRLAGEVGLAVACISILNAFDLESQSLFFKGFVAVFSLTMAYVFGKMIRDTARKK